MTQTIGLVAAMPEEIKPVLKLTRDLTQDTVAGFTRYRFTLGGHDCCLVESGMGARRAAAATAALITACSPAVIVNFGFAGAVTAGLAVGDVICAENVLDYDNGRELLSTQPPGEAGPCAGRPALPAATIVTAGKILDKRTLATELPADTGPYVLDMETAAVVRQAHLAGLPVLALRAISDGADEELGFSIEEFVDDTMTVRPWRVMATMAKRPWIIPQLLRLAGNVSTAGRSLAAAVAAALEQLPP